MLAYEVLTLLYEVLFISKSPSACPKGDSLLMDISKTSCACCKGVSLPIAISKSPSACSKGSSLSMVIKLYVLFDFGDRSGVGSSGEQLLLGLYCGGGVSGAGDVGDLMSFVPVVGAALHVSMKSLSASIISVSLCDDSMSVSVSSMLPGNENGEVALFTLQRSLHRCCP